MKKRESVYYSRKDQFEEFIADMRITITYVEKGDPILKQVVIRADSVDNTIKDFQEKNCNAEIEYILIRK